LYLVIMESAMRTLLLALLTFTACGGEAAHVQAGALVAEPQPAEEPRIERVERVELAQLAPAASTAPPVVAEAPAPDLDQVADGGAGDASPSSIVFYCVTEGGSCTTADDCTGTAPWCTGGSCCSYSPDVGYRQ
jgi:hypothetical protein